jgi:hypothetical protein
MVPQRIQQGQRFIVPIDGQRTFLAIHTAHAMAQMFDLQASVSSTVRAAMREKNHHAGNPVC